VTLDLLMKAVATVSNNLARESAKEARFRSEVLQRLDSLEENFKLLLSTPEKKAEKLLNENEKVTQLKKRTKRKATDGYHFRRCLKTGLLEPCSSSCRTCTPACC
jgi:flagellar motility protein MotE (MotC chaperone)